MKKILVIAPHPDDEVLGCGGTIINHVKKGDEVYLCIATKAYTPDWSEEFIENRSKEIAESNKILGIKKTFFLDFPAAKLDTIDHREINRAIGEVVKTVEPEIVYVPYEGDLHEDHKIIFNSSLVDLRPAHSPYVKKVLSYEVLSETDWASPGNAFDPNFFVDISHSLGEKLKAMQAYKSELKEWPNSRSLEVIEALAKIRGAKVNLKFAESFILIRQIQ